MNKFEKIASRAWKRNWGNLSESTKQKLVDSGIHNYERELHGLNRGTGQILKKYKAIQMNEKNYNRKAGKILSKGGIDMAPLKASLVGTPEMNKKIGRTPLSFIYRGYNGVNQNAVIVPSKKLQDKQTKILVGSNVPKKGIDRKYFDALIRRHEADEIRSGNRKEGMNRLIDKFNGLASNHHGADVISRESANVAIAPKKVQDTFKTVQKADAYRKGFSSVAKAYKVGKPYGQDAVINKAHEKIYKNIYEKGMRPDKLSQRARLKIGDLGAFKNVLKNSIKASKAMKQD